MELIKKQIHMNQWKGNVTTQITLDDDFIVPDTLDDMEQVMLDTGEIQIETVKNQGDKVAVKGKLEFQVLYRKESGGLQTLGGNIPFEEVVNVQGLEEKDYVGLNWMLEDLNTDMINSRKLGVQAIITLQVRACLTRTERDRCRWRRLSARPMRLPLLSGARIHTGLRRNLALPEASPTLAGCYGGR